MNLISEKYMQTNTCKTNNGNFKYVWTNKWTTKDFKPQGKSVMSH